MGCVGFDALLRHGYDIRAVITHPDDPGETIWWEPLSARAADRAVPLILRRRADEPGLLEAIAAHRPDVLFSFHYRHLLPPEALAIPRRGAFNLHGSLLPRYRGRAPVNWVLVNGETETGVTLHAMTAQPDAGDILGQEAVGISLADTAYTLLRKLEVAAARLLDRTLPAIASGTARAVPQDAARASRFGRRTPADGRIDWRMPARRIYDLVRAVTHPWPGAFTTLRERTLFVWWAQSIEGPATAPPGCVVEMSRDGVVVAAGEGNVRLVTLQIEEQPELPAGALALIEGVEPGERLGGERRRI
jgi:UDP-4-amino-4-deoxy-L-arabinose formyltransferase/UDP-glucuronic acid dehydrogenase (UDP-4-keto-hexauronic acid decarboxylating)